MKQRLGVGLTALIYFFARDPAKSGRRLNLFANAGRENIDQNAPPYLGLFGCIFRRTLKISNAQPMSNTKEKSDYGRCAVAPGSALNRPKAYYVAKKRNGFEWFCFDGAHHNFHRRVGDKYQTLLCTEEQLENGDFDFMADNELTISVLTQNLEQPAKSVAALREEVGGCVGTGSSSSPNSKAVEHRRKA